PPTSSIGRLMKELAPSETVKLDQNVRREPIDPALSTRIGTMRKLPTDADRAKLVLEVAPQIQALPAGAGKLALARSLAGVSTEGDLGRPALNAVVAALAASAREAN